MDQPTNPFAGFAEVTGQCARHGGWSVRLPPSLARRFAEAGVEGCPSCGREMIAAKRDEDLAASDSEIAAARQRWAETLLGRAAVPGQFRDASLGDSCAYPQHREVLERLRKYIAVWPERLRKGASIVLHGITGNGKSTAAAATLKAALNLGARGTFLRQDALSAMVRACYGPKASRTEDEIMAELIGMDLLVIDEIGVGKTTVHEIRMLNSVICGRHEEMRPTIITTNMTRASCEDYLGERLQSRMRNWTWIACEWPSYRETQEYVTGARAA